MKLPTQPETPGMKLVSTDFDAPKTVPEGELRSFCCRANLMGGMSPAFPEICGKRYEFSAKSEERGGGFMAAINELIARYDVAQYNGRSEFTCGLPDDFGAAIDAAYASGQRLSASDNVYMFLPLGFIAELAALFGDK